MATNKSIVYLGFVDEEILGKHVSTLSSNINKIGGNANWPSSEIKVPVCPLCGKSRPLLVQLYAPLEQSQFHRTLYIFACLYPTCSKNSKSWLCIRTQHLDIPNQCDILSTSVAQARGKTKKNNIKQAAYLQKISWCGGEDDWGEEMDTEADDFGPHNEENGNMVGKNNISPTRSLAAEIELIDDEVDDEDSTSMENDIICGLGQLDMHCAQNAAEDPNANCASGMTTATSAGDLLFVGGVATATICAEIEGAETDLVLVESPKKPDRDLIALFNNIQSASDPFAKLTDVTLKSYFIAADIEERNFQHDYEHYEGSLSADHIRELYQEYKKQDEKSASVVADCDAGGAAGGAEDQESYEKALPAHGDIIFHQFISTLQQNPGQILRYSRDTLPLLISPLTEAVPKCPNCSGETICELQILSTLIPKLRLQHSNEAVPIEYGNVLVFTCLKSCWDTPDKMRYERVLVQAEK